MPRQLHDDDAMVWACPECDSAPVYRRTQDNTQLGGDSEYVCYACRSGFDQPVERESRLAEGGGNEFGAMSEDMKERVGVEGSD